MSVEEIRAKVRELLLANETLAGLLASEGAIYLESPPIPRELPCLTYRLDSLPDAELDRYGKVGLVLTIEAWSRSQSVNDAILKELDATLFDVRFATASWTVRFCRRVEAAETVEGREPSPVRRLRTVWKMRVHRK